LNKSKNILICPLDWGLGHATRCVPIIQKLVEAGANVIIGADKRPLAFLKKEFPELQFVEFPGYDIHYSEKGSMVLTMLLSAPGILQKIRRERKLLQKIIDEHKIDIVISDNRYGLWNKKIKCVFITHQLSIKCPTWLHYMEYILMQINKHYIHKFDECWVPDIKGMSSCSGFLSKKHRRFKNVHFIGLLSRFDEPQYVNLERKPIYDVLFILSGPEPQRTVFEKIILAQLKESDKIKALVVRGMTDSSENSVISENVQMVAHLETAELAKAMAEAKLVICRPGYSSIMDIVTMGVNAYFVPTPGQTEQEYLARYFHKKNTFYFTKQENFNIVKAIQKSTFSKGIKIKNEKGRLDERIRSLLS